MSTKLTEKQKRFCLEYLIDFNATQAAVRAGYSKKTSKQIGSENLSKPVLQEFLAKKVTRVNEKLELTVERILEEQMRLAFVDTSKLFDEDGNLIPINELPEDITRAISSVNIEQISLTDDKGGETVTRKFRYKLWDKKDALAKLMQYMGMLVTKNEHSGPNGEPIRTETKTEATINLKNLSDDELKNLRQILGRTRFEHFGSRN